MSKKGQTSVILPLRWIDRGQQRQNDHRLRDFSTGRWSKSMFSGSDKKRYKLSAWDFKPGLRRFERV